MQKIFFDFEVFKHLWLVVFKNYDTKETTNIINNKEELTDFYEKNKDNIFVGYNSRNYDQWILKGIILGYNPFDISNEIIANGKSGGFLIKNHEKLKFINFDLSNKFRGLKELEGFMGSKIKESSVDFNLDRELTETEIEEVLEYCQHDVSQTIEVFENLKEEFDSQLLMIETFNLPLEKFNETKAKLSAYVLGAEKPKEDRGDEFDISFPDTLILDKYKFVMDWYKDKKNLNYDNKLICDVAGVSHVFGFGGVHGAINSYVDEGFFMNVDVSSFYPAIMIEYNFLSRNVKDNTKYREIRDTRIEFKKMKDRRQSPLKIVLN